MCREQSDHYSDVIVRSLMTSNDIMMSVSCDILNTKQGHYNPLTNCPMTSPCLFFRPMIQDSSSRLTLSSIQICSLREDPGCESIVVAMTRQYLIWFYHFFIFSKISQEYLYNKYIKLERYHRISCFIKYNLI